MIRTIKLMLFVITLASTAHAQPVDYSGLYLPVEMRAIWIDAGAIPKTEQGVRELVRTYHRSNINTLFPESVMRGYAIYDSKYVGRDPRFEGAPDLLAVMIDEAHKLDMEVHPWVWVFRAGYTQDVGSILRAHPDWMAVNKQGKTLSANGGYWISQCNEQARDLLANLLAELVTRYDIDGLHLDYVRFEVESPIPYGYSEECRSMFRNKYGTDPIDIDRLSFQQYEWNSFRERLINTFVQRIALQTRALKPNVKISAAVGSDPVTARLNLMQNWPHWAANKWVDFVTPMAYSNKDETFTRLVTAQVDAAGDKTLIIPGVGLHVQKDNPQQTVGQIGIARQLGTAGQALFASSYYGEPQMNALVQGPYSAPALLPFRDPANRSQQLADLAEQHRAEGNQALADYYAQMSTNLTTYAEYQAAQVDYVPPTQPPLNIPETVVPLPMVRIPGATSLIVTDGKLDDPAWNTAAQVQLEYTAPGDAAQVQTTVRLVYDEKNLYVAFEAREPMIDRIKAIVDKRDGPTFYDDSVEVFIDPAAKAEDYYHLSTNTLGTRFDQKVFNAGWNAEWDTATTKSADGYVTEITIPFEALGVQPPKQGDRWTLNMTRNRTVTGEMQYITWAVPYGSFHTPDRFGSAVFE